MNAQWLLPALCLVTLLVPATLHANEIETLRREVVRQHARQVHANYADALAAAGQLREAVGRLLQRPAEDTLRAARQAWLDSRVPYLQTEVCRFYDGPIEQVETFVNAWPMDEFYVDYVREAPGTGIIQLTNLFPRLDREMVLALNEKEGEKNICTGFHALEFMLWGQDFNPHGPGNRPWQDFTPGHAGDRLVVERRRVYLRVIADLLVEHLAQVVEAWDPGRMGNYRERFLALPVTESLALILRGAGSMSGPELAGERLTVAYETKEQEDEHSCFSDNTHNDFIYDAVGLENVYLGRYRRLNGELVKGPGVFDLLRSVDAALAEKLAAQVAECVTLARALPAPFDQAIRGANDAPGREAVRRLRDAFQRQSDLIARAGHMMNLKLRF